MSGDGAEQVRAARRRRVALGLLCAGLCFAAAVGAQLGANRARTQDRGAGLLYLPNEKLLNHFTAGLSPVIADLLWLHCVQYVAVENREARNFTWLEHMVFTVTRLDPYFRDAYRYGSIFLTALKADAESGMKLLEQGMVRVPGAWELPYEAAMVHLLNRRDEADSKKMAAFFLGMSAATGNAPSGIALLAGQLQSAHNLADIEEAMWRDMLRSGDRLLRDLAERKLKEMEIRAALRVLQERADQFKAGAGRPPARVEELVSAGLLRAVPPDPLGGGYFFGPDGTALNTTLLDGEARKSLDLMRRRVKAFQEREGRFPVSLDELVEKKLLSKIPAHPHPEKTWQYNPATGEVN